MPNIKKAQFSSVAIDDMRGYFVLGSSCIKDTMVCTNPILKGEVVCNNSGVYPSDDWDIPGKYCWCRLTHVVAPNGYLASYDGGWVLNRHYYWVPEINDIAGAANLAAEEVRSNVKFFRVLLSAGQI